MPKIRPRSLRRTFISIALRANQFHVKWMTSQVGDADSRMMIGVHAQLVQRDRSRGESFNRLPAEA